MSRSTLTADLQSAMSFREREKHKADVRAAAEAALDFPVLPTSASDPAPALPEQPDDNLTPAQRLAVAALACGQTFVAAAGAAGVSRRTLLMWRGDPAFAKAVDDLSRQAMSTVTIRLRNLMLRATRVASESLLESARAPDLAIKVLNSKQIWQAALATDRGVAEEIEASPT